MCNTNDIDVKLHKLDHKLVIHNIFIDHVDHSVNDSGFHHHHGTKGKHDIIYHKHDGGTVHDHDHSIIHYEYDGGGDFDYDLYSPADHDHDDDGATEHRT